LGGREKGQVRRPLEDPALISERRFCVSHTSIWVDILPYSDRFIRRVNLEALRFVEPTPQTAFPSVSGIVNDAAYRLAEISHSQGVRVASLREEVVDRAIDKSSRWLGHSELPLPIRSNIGPIHIEVRDVARGIEVFLESVLAGVTCFRPLFRGCGIVDACEGDVTVDDVLVEVKSGDRNFLSVDLRQLLVYSALKRAAGEGVPASICLVNPRAGRYWMDSLGTVAEGCGSPSTLQMLDDITSSMTTLAASTL
jgi:hypothetical protein